MVSAHTTFHEQAQQSSITVMENGKRIAVVVENYDDDDDMMSLVSSSSSSSSSSTNSPVVDKRLRFNRQVSVKKTISVHDMSDDEISNYWMTQTEQDEIRERCKEEGRKHSSSSSKTKKKKKKITAVDNADDEDNNSSFTTRGLESFLTHTRQIKKMNRYEATMAVIDEIDQQYLEYGSIYDHRQIALIYQEISRQCQIEAEARALVDRRDVLLTIRADEQQKKRQQTQQQEEQEEGPVAEEPSKQQKRKLVPLKRSKYLASKMSSSLSISSPTSMLLRPSSKSIVVPVAA